MNEPSYPMRDPKDLEWQKQYIKDNREYLKTTEGQLNEAKSWLLHKKVFYKMYENRPTHPTAISVREEILYYEKEIEKMESQLAQVRLPPPAAQIHPPFEIHPDDAYRINMNV